MAKVYRPKISPVFPKSAEFVQPPLEYTEKKKDGVVTYEPKERRGKIDFHSEPPFTEGSAVTSASTFGYFRDACSLLRALQQLVAKDDPPFVHIPNRPFTLPSHVSQYDRPFFSDAFANEIVEPSAPSDPSHSLAGWKYHSLGPVSYLAYLFHEGAAVAGLLGGYDEKYPSVASLPYVPRLLAVDPGAKSFISSSSRTGSGTWVPCLSHIGDAPDTSPGGDVDQSERTYADLVSDAFHKDPGSGPVADVMSKLPAAPDYPLVDAGSGYDESVSRFHFNFPSRAVPMLLAYFAQCLDSVGCVFGGTMRSAAPGVPIGSSAGSGRSATVEPVRFASDGSPVGWPRPRTTKTGESPVYGDSVDMSLLFHCMSNRPGSGGGGTGMPGPSANLGGSIPSDEADAAIAEAIAATSDYQGVPSDSAVCVRAGDASVIAKAPRWLDLVLRGFLYVTASYTEGGQLRESSTPETCSHDALGVEDYVTAYLAVSFKPSAELTSRDGSGKVVWVPDGSMSELVANAVAVVTGTGGLRRAPHAEPDPPDVVSVKFDTGDGYDPAYKHPYTEDTSIHTDFAIGTVLHCLHVLIPGGFFCKSSLDSSE